uniref:P2X purinoceptor n=1 Tax=Laticauda laticaudata TaxID=8630 RepID=A0A8C5SH30_LATLA
MAACSSLRSVFEFETNKVVRIYSVWYGSLKSIIHFMVFLYVSIVLLADRRYQKKDSVISSMHVKVKGVSQTENRVWDTAEYTIPGQGVNSFFVLTNIITTENQTQGLCPEFPFAKAVCTTDKSCTKGRVDPQGNGIQTGKCVKYNRTINTCEVSAWCPVESTKAAPTPAILGSAENFTVLIKNNIHFPKFDYTKTNIPPEFNISCTYNKHKAPLCPIFRLRDILQEAGEKFSEVAVQGGIIGIEINWDCNLDKWGHHCKPNYGFRRLDDKRANEALYPGYNFRFARYYKQPDGREGRTLIKAYGIRFDILIFGTAGKFSIIQAIMSIGSMLSYFGMVRYFPTAGSRGEFRGECLASGFKGGGRSPLPKNPLWIVQMRNGKHLFGIALDEQYIRWRFGEGDLGARAVIPNCCRWRIRYAFPSENGEYHGCEEQFGMAAPVP